jgi:HlyD family secretion protein
MGTRSAVARLASGFVLAAALGCGGDGAREPLVLAGTLEARTVEVGSLVGGRVERVAVDEGAEVAAGDLLVRLESDLLDRAIEGQRARVAEAEARLDLAVAGPTSQELQRARIEWEAAKTDLARISALHDEGVVSRAAYDLALVREGTAAETYEELEVGTRREELAAARAALDATRAELARLEREREEVEVRASVGGRIESIDLRPGDLVSPNQPVAVLLEPGELWARVYVPEPSLARASIGQPARVRVDTWPGRDFAGRVVEIRHEAEYLPRNVQTLDQRSDQVFAVKVALEAADELRPGMAASITLVEVPAAVPGERGESPGRAERDRPERAD